MKKLFWLSLAVFSLAQLVRAKDFNDDYRFIYYAVTEGCYEDGIATTNIDQILLWQTNSGYVHFVYACPVCMPTIHALDAYRARPQHLFGMKTRLNTFGPGLNAEQIKKLYSERPADRLEVINELMKNWIARRMEKLRLTETERNTLKDHFKKMREEGMKMMKMNEHNSPDQFNMGAFSEVKQCAACNGACDMSIWQTQDK